MSNLDEQLRQTLLGPTSTDEAIQLVKQIFVDEGWIPGRMTPNGYLATGQEWYGRFEKVLLNSDSPLPYPKQINVFRKLGLESEARLLEGDHLIEVIKALAKKASGIDNG